LHEVKPRQRKRDRLFRLTLVFAPAAIVIVAGALSYAAQLRGLRTRDWVLHTRVVLNTSSRLLTALLDAETGQRGYIISRDSSLLVPYLGAAPRADSLLSQLRLLTRDNPVEQARVDTLALRTSQRLGTIDSTLMLARTRGGAAAAAAITRGPGHEYMQDVRRLIDELQREEEGLLVEREREDAHTNVIAALVLIAGTVLAGLLAFMVNRAMGRALDERDRAVTEFETANERLQEQAVELETQSEAAQSAALEAEQATEHVQSALDAVEESERRASRLQAATEAFGGALSLSDVADLIIAQALSALNAHSGIIGAVEENGDLRIVATRDVGNTNVGQVIDPARDIPLSAAVRRGEPVLVPNADAARTQFPAIVERHARDGIQAVAAFPIQNGGRVVGSLLVRFTRPRSLSRNDMAFMVAMSRIAGEALERARLFEAERTARTAAEAANRAKAAFLASMSHELRTPLQAALGFAQLIRSGLYGPITTEQSEILGRVERSQTHLTRLIDDILDFARLEAGRVRMNVEEVSVAEAISQLRPLVEQQAVKKGIELSLEPPPTPLVVAADKHRLQQILVNLVGNAIKFTPESGTIRVGAAGDGELATIHVWDTGPGIPADRLQSIFEPFVQVNDGHTRPHSGVGLGLAISRDLALAMGGELAVESVMGVGSTFSVRLPLARSHAESIQSRGTEVPA
jgi:signal transduction histidine kinase/CHASE3 domain sensor protein